MKSICLLFDRRRAFFVLKKYISVAIIVLLAVVMGSSGSYATNTNYVHRPTGLVLPLKISFFKRGDIRDYDLNYPGLGTGIPYNFADINAMVHIYDRGRNGLEVKVDDIKAEVKSSMDEVYDKVKERYYGSVELLDPPSVFRSGGGKRPVYMAGFTINVGSQTFREYIYVTSYKKHFVKIKITHSGSLSDDIVRNAFLNKLISMLSGDDVKVERPEPKRSKPKVKRSKHEIPHLEDLELYEKK